MLIAECTGEHGPHGGEPSGNDRPLLAAPGPALQHLGGIGGLGPRQQLELILPKGGGLDGCWVRSLP